MTHLSSEPASTGMRKEIRGVEIPAIGLGTWQMDGRSCATAVEQALNMGYRHIDTAQMYGNEKYVGEGIRDADVDREDVFVTTKVWRTDLAYGDVKQTVHESLERLDTSYVDLLLIHWPNPDIPLEDTLRAMQELQDDGLTAHIGVSNFTIDLLNDAREIAPDILTNQAEMHVYHQQRGMREYCQEHELLLTAYSPLSRGRVLADETLQRIARKHEKSVAQIALRWLIQQEPVIAIPKAEPEQYQRENLSARDVELDADDMQTLFDIEHRQKFVDPGHAPW